MLSKFLTNVLVPISRLRILRLDNKQITQIHLNVHSSNRLSSRFYSNEVRLKEIQKFFKENSSDKSTETILYYSVSAVILTFGLTFAAVPLYRAFCQSTGYGGYVVTEGHDISKVATMEPVADRVLTIKFNADKAASLRWNFKPLQHEIRVVPGETALAFYTAVNPTDVPIIGVSVYNVLPFDAAQYFNKIQCFCFEAQQLNPHEEVDMPVFFYIDPDFAEDPNMENVHTIVLSYTFNEAKDGASIPVPNYSPK